MLKKIRLFSSDIYFWTLAILLISLPFLPKLLVICQIILIANWLVEGGIKKKLNVLLARKSILIFLGIYSVHILWIYNTRNLNGAFTDLLMKLPLLILPVIIGTSAPLGLAKLKKLMMWFTLSIVIATIISASLMLELLPFKITDVRDTLFISNVRFALFVVIIILFQTYWLINKTDTYKKLFLYAMLIIWLFVFLIFLKSLTGILVLFATYLIVIALQIRRIKNLILRITLIASLCAIPVIGFIYVSSVVGDFYDKDNVNFSKLSTHTINNQPYTNDTTSWMTENGHYVWINVCIPELRNEWNKRSKISFDSCDVKNQRIYSTLTRYMASRNITKDSCGIWQLSDTDISNIEKGYTNHIFADNWSLYPRIYETIWELDQKRYSGNANAHSLTMRFVYMGISYEFFKQNKWLGIGAGNIKDDYKQYYATHNTGIEPSRQHITHNQFLLFLTVFGIVGFILILFAFTLPPIIEKAYNSYYFLVVFIVVFLSFLNEDTLETQVGVTFVAFFYSLSLWGIQTDSNQKNDQPAIE
jgi:hypothetical protein